MPNYDYDPADHDNGKGDGGGNNDYIPVGKHIVRVIDHELSETKSGLGQVIVTFEAKDGRTRKAWLICEGRAGFQFGGLLNACEWTGKIRISAPGVLKKAIYGKDIEIVVVDEEYQGKNNTKVKWINKAPGGFGGAGAQREERDTGRSGGGGGYAPEDDGFDVPF